MVVSGCAVAALGVEIILVVSIVVMTDAKMLSAKMREIIATLSKAALRAQFN